MTMHRASIGVMRISDALLKQHGFQNCDRRECADPEGTARWYINDGRRQALLCEPCVRGLMAISTSVRVLTVPRGTIEGLFGAPSERDPRASWYAG